MLDWFEKWLYVQFFILIRNYNCKWHICLLIKRHEFCAKKNLIDVYDSFERYHELRLINNKNSQLPFCYSITNVISVVMFPNFEYFRLVRILQFDLTSGSPSRLQRRRPRRDSEESGIGWIRQTIDPKHHQVSTTCQMC